MEEQVSGRTQGVAFGLVLVAVVVAVGGYYYTKEQRKGQLSPDTPLYQLNQKLGVELVKGKAQIGTSKATGAGIKSVLPGGIAEKGGLKAGDVIVSVQGRPVTGLRDLKALFDVFGKRKETTLFVYRAGKTVTVQLLAEAPQAVAPSPPPADGSCPVSQVGSMLGVEVLKGHAPTASGGSGAGIQSVTPEGIGAKAGLQAGDVVVSANNLGTSCPRDLLEALSAFWPKGPVTLSVERKGEPLKIVIPAKAPVVKKVETSPPASRK